MASTTARWFPPGTRNRSRTRRQFPADIEDREVLRACLLEPTEQVARGLRHQSLRGPIVQIKLRFADFRTITRSKKLPQPTDSTDVLWQTAADLLVTSLADRSFRFAYWAWA